MSTSSTSGSYFSGESSFSASLNNVISQAVARATLPITLLQNQQSALTNEQSEVQTLGNDFVAVQTAIDGLNTAASTSAYSATVDVPTVATATASSTALPGTYTLAVSSLGSQTNTISPSGSITVTNPSSQNISSATSFTLTINGTAKTITPAGTSLNALVTAINASGSNVQATVVNVGGSASPDYRLSVQGTRYAPDTIQLSDGTNNNLLSTLNPGTYVTYTVNGQPTTPINSTSRTLSLSTGLTANVLTTGTANITVAQSSSNIATAINSFVTAYNAATAELTKNRGQNGGALSGNSLISQLQRSLNSIGAYSSTSGGSSAVSSISDLGLSFDQNGNLTFDSAKFNAVSSSSPAAVTAFLGSETTGGFIESAHSALTSLIATGTGSISVAGDNIGSAINSLTNQISSKQTQVTQLQSNLTTQMANADAAIASLQGQLSQITSLFAAENQVSQNINGVG